MTLTPRPDRASPRTPPLAAARTFALGVALVAAVGLGCSDHTRQEIHRDPERQRRVIDPPPRGVRALPPHAIRADGVGPYRLGARLSKLLDQLPSGPRIAQLNLPGVVHRDLLRAEEDEILIGGEPQGRASFVGVIGAEVARTESDIHVGSTRAEVLRALGPALDTPDHARDPRLLAPSQLPNLHVVFDGDRVIALVVTAEGRRGDAVGARGETPRPVPPREPAGGANGCARPTPEPATDASPTLHTFGACLSSTGEVAGFDGDTLEVLGPERALAATRVPGLVFAAPLRAADGRDELVAIARVDEGQTRSWTLSAYRLEGARLVRMLEPAPLYQLSAANARWIGAELRDLDLYLELTSRPDAIEVGGLLTTTISGKLRDIVVISPVSVARRRPTKPGPTEPATPADAGAEAPAAPATMPADAASRSSDER